MADYLLDTNILRYWYDKRCQEHSRVLTHVHSVRQPEPTTLYVPLMFLSAITLGEMEFGHRANPSGDGSSRTDYIRFVTEQCPEVLEIDRHVCACYGELRAWLFDNCAPKGLRRKVRRPEQLVDPVTARELAVDENDIWIAAHAMTLKLVLVTNDSRGNFGKLLRQFQNDIVVQYWAR